METRECANATCELLFAVNTHSFNHTSSHRYCSRNCKELARKSRRLAAKKKRINRTCPICGVEFVTCFEAKIFCEKKCTDIAAYRRLGRTPQGSRWSFGWKVPPPEPVKPVKPSLEELAAQMSVEEKIRVTKEILASHV